MPALDLAPAPTPAPRLDMGPEDVNHLFCQICDDDIAICGYRVDGGEWAPVTDGESLLCPLCADMEDAPCPRCGIL